MNKTPHEIVHKESGRIIGTYPTWDKAYEAYNQLGTGNDGMSDHAIGEVDTPYLERVRQSDAECKAYLGRYEAMRINRGEPPKEITRQRFWELLEVLMPADWTQAGTTESFRVIECQTEDLYTWCARVGDRYYEMICPKKTTHAKIMKLVKELNK
jgi:hypothetical protein